GRPFILAVSSQSVHKNFGGIWRALDYLKDQTFDTVVTGARNTRIFNDASPEVPGKARYLGYVGDAELRALYENAICLVYPSLYEGFGLPPLEAMACGCPVVVSPCGSLPEVCGDAAVYCDPHDPVDIARATATVMGDPTLRSTLKTRGMDRAKHFTWGRTASSLAAVIEEVALL
ncbi:MAG: glycosyltransferase family 4 protein, partial [bacterium]